MLDRLCDENPDKLSSSDNIEAFTQARYKQSVLRDLDFLLNSTSHISPLEVTEFSEVANSVLCYGPPDLTGRNIGSLIKSELEIALRETILKFEPRVIPTSLEVKLIPDVQPGKPNIVQFEIQGYLWSNPMPERFMVKTYVDLDTGQFEI
ncbi:MAG: type VI secretion system baseplate subunit TssE [Chthoniobacterales bacterium]|nr:type VI secretion system baseplate subunit TssE [Chthoniobacterales bacterium]